MLAVSLAEGGSVVTLDTDVTISDAELDALNGGSGNYAGASLSIARNGGADGDDVLSVVTSGTLTVAGGPNGGGTISSAGNVIATITDAGDDDELTITFANNGTIPTTALVNEVMQAIRYSNSSDGPDASVQLDWTFSDGNSGNSQGTGDNPGTTTGSTTVSVTAVNDEPTLTATGQNPTFTENGSASDLFSGVTADTVESSQTFSGLTLTVTNVSDTGAEILTADGTAITLDDSESGTTATNSLSYSVSVSGSTATISFTGGTLSEAALQTMVDGLTYSNTSDSPSTGANRVVTITSVTDSGSNSGANDNTASLAISSTVSLTAVNDAPVVSNIFGDRATEIVAGSGAGDVTDLNDVTVTNADSADYNGGSLTIAQTSGTTNGAWGVDGTTVTSGGDASISAGETIQVGGVTIGTVDATDNGQGGTDFTINFNTANATSANIQTLLRALTYSGPSGIDDRDFTLTLNDADGTANGGDEDASGSFTIGITPNPPTMANLDGDSLTFTEGDSPTLLDVSSNATLTDADSANFDGGNITVSYQSGGQAEDLLTLDTSGVISLAGTMAGSNVSVSGTIVGTLGNNIAAGNNLVVTFNSNATPALVQSLIRAIQYDNEGSDNPTDGDRVIRVTVTDAGSNAATGTADITVNVDPVNDAPTGVSLPTDVTVTEDTASDVDLSAANFTDDDSASITVTLTIDAGTFSTPVDGSGVGGGVTETLVNSTTITLTGDADDIDTYLDTASNIQYTSAANEDSADAATITITANDGDGSGDVAIGTVSVDVTGVNDLPTSSGGARSVTTGKSLSFTGANFNFSDVDTGDSLASVRIDTLPSKGNLKLSGVAVTAGQVIAVANIGNLTYSAPGGGATTASFTYSVNDGTGFATNPATMALTIKAAPAPANSAPTAPTLSALSLQENAKGAVVGTVSATDPDGDTLTYTVSDTRFTILDGNLKLKLGQSIDFETEPTIEITITATDPDNASTASNFTLAVGDVNEQQVGDDDDTVAGVDGPDDIKSGNGNDKVSSGNGKDTIDGGGGNDNINGGNDDDRIIGGDGADTVDGGSGNDLVWAGFDDLGDDTVFGSGGNDTLGGGAGNDTINGGGDNDLIWGRNGDDTLEGGSGDDILYNGSGTDMVEGGAGDDTLWAGNGDDVLSGGTGDDVFVFGNNSGNDTVTDFDAGEDVLDMRFASTDFTDLASVQAAATETTQNAQAGVLIDLGDGDSVFLVGITIADLTDSNVIL